MLFRSTWEIIKKNVIKADNSFNDHQHYSDIEIDCECTEEDYECDIGFIRNESFHCVSNNSKLMQIICKEGEIYNISSGYKKIQQDSCIGGITHKEISVVCPKFQLKESSVLSGIFGLCLAFGIFMGMMYIWENLHIIKRKIRSIFTRGNNKEFSQVESKDYDEDDYFVSSQETTELRPINKHK